MINEHNREENTDDDADTVYDDGNVLKTKNDDEKLEQEWQIVTQLCL